MTTGPDATPRHLRHLDRVQEFLKQIVYGGNDGIVTTFAIVAGFAGAGAGGTAQIGGIAVLLFGLANLFADAVSMGLGEFLSERSEREVWREQRAKALADIASNPDGEVRELAALIVKRGAAPEDADGLARALLRSPALMAELSLSFDLGLTGPGKGSAGLRALVTFVAFVVFGSIPILPYFLHDPAPGVFTASVAATFGALALLGLLRWHATGERLARALGETLVVGGICAVVAYLVGVLVGG